MMKNILSLLGICALLLQGSIINAQEQPKSAKYIINDVYRDIDIILYAVDKGDNVIRLMPTVLQTSQESEHFEKTLYARLLVNKEVKEIIEVPLSKADLEKADTSVEMSKKVENGLIYTIEPDTIINTLPNLVLENIAEEKPLLLTFEWTNNQKEDSSLDVAERDTLALSICVDKDGEVVIKKADFEETSKEIAETHHYHNHNHNHDNGLEVPKQETEHQFEMQALIGAGLIVVGVVTLIFIHQKRNKK